MNHSDYQPEEELLQLEAASEEEARKAAAEHWDISESEVLLKVVEEEKSFFGLFGRKLRVEARPQHSAYLRNARMLLQKLLKAMDLDLSVNVSSHQSLNLSGSDGALLVGDRGEGLKALDYILNLMARNEGPSPRVVLDCNGFRHQRERALERQALSAAKEVMRTHRTIYLEPMSSWERRIVHLALRESTNVETHSIGEEPHRKVAIRLIGRGNSSRPSSGNYRHPSRERRQRSSSRPEGRSEGRN